MEVALAGNWLAPLVFVAITAFRIFCEELWFRGYMMPRQEAALGGRTWWIHALCWLLFLAIQPWDLARAVPGALLVAYAAHKLQNTTVTLLGRILAAAPAVVRIIQGVTAS
jgi:membrane protease YdiL (CAAX protease family)